MSDRDSLPDQDVCEPVPVPVWTIRPGSIARGWSARVQGPASALDLELVPAITLWDAYRATCDGVPLPFGAWITQDGPTTTVAEVEELRDAYDTVGEQLTAAEAERDVYKAALEEIEGSPRAGIGCDQQVIARAALNQYRSPGTSDEDGASHA